MATTASGTQDPESKQYRQTLYILTKPNLYKKHKPFQIVSENVSYCVPIIIFQILFIVRAGTLVNMSFLCACQVPEKTDKTSNLTWGTSMTYCATADVLRMIRERRGDLVWVNKRVTAECLRSISRENEMTCGKDNVSYWESSLI